MRTLYIMCWAIVLFLTVLPSASTNSAPPLWTAAHRIFSFSKQLFSLILTLYSDFFFSKCKNSNLILNILFQLFPWNFSIIITFISKYVLVLLLLQSLKQLSGFFFKSSVKKHIWCLLLFSMFSLLRQNIFFHALYNFEILSFWNFIKRFFSLMEIKQNTKYNF